MQQFQLAPPRRLAVSVACVAAATLLFEVVITRIFSILFFYHFSFFAITLVMSGLVLGGIVAARWDASGLSNQAFDRRLATLSALFAGGMATSLLCFVAFARPETAETPSAVRVALYAFLFLPGLIAAGAFLALAFARNKTWIGTLYAWDLVAAALACISAIFLLRTVQGPAVLLCPVLLAAIAAVLMSRRAGSRAAGLALAALALVLMVANQAVDGRLLRLRAMVGGVPAPTPMLERWNEHSRIQVFDLGDRRALVIDRSANTLMPALPPRADGRPVQADPSWAAGAQYQVYRLGRPLRRVAIIGVGGGPDLLPPLYHGATRIDGYEVNGILVDLLSDTFHDFNAIATRPEIHLIHDEARVGITHSGAEYDVIQASMIDTWAATASGGFVLSENGLYTREAWKTFLTHLGTSGVLTMTRWHIPDAPAETYRLVALAGAALSDIGLPDASARVMLIGDLRATQTRAFSNREGTLATILVSKAPFTPGEVERLRVACDAQGLTIMLAPGFAPSDPTLAELLGPDTRGPAIQKSRFDIRPPRDVRPYFFLQLRPSDLVNLSHKDFGQITEITFNAVRIVMILGGCALLLVLLVALLTAFSLPGSTTTPAQRQQYRRMTIYFLGIGLGYMFVQVGLQQRLVIVLGHPTLALSVVLFSMLLGTGIGAALSARLIPDGNIRRAGSIIVVSLSALWIALPFVPQLERVHAIPLRIGGIVLVLAGVGFVLGLAFPLGVRRVASTGEWAVQKMWAINGAASIGASVLAALVGLAFGTPAVIATGIVAYVVALIAGEPSSVPHSAANRPVSG